MVYPSDIEIKLGFDQLREKLSAFCFGVLGQEHVDNIRISNDYEAIKKKLNQTLELQSLKSSGETLPLSNYEDPNPYWSILAIEGSYIEADALYQIAKSIQLVFDCKDFLGNRNHDCPTLFELISSINLDRQLIKSIHSKIDESGQLKDNASHELLRIRKKLKEERSKIRQLTDRLFRKATEDGLVPEDSIPVLRQGRVVIPIKAEHKRRLRGAIMDESATGQTVYIEPTEVLEANNEIRNLELEERRESIRILKELAGELRAHIIPLKHAFDILGILDMIQSKMRLANEMNAGLPDLSDKPVLDWVNATHPLLLFGSKNRESIVPLTINLSDADRFLLVSGPNAGGKSVCLKTVGLLQYMLQCGLLIPVHESSKVGIFQEIYLDIGDQQSIENDLSTYSSHLRNMRFFVENSSEESLLLIDELGAGTDPNFGGGIAEAILNSLVAKKSWGIVTTHYYNLKMFAEHQAGIRNAAMLFDSKRLEPKFILEIGKPGSSFALEIARKTGLPISVLHDAEQNIGKELIGLESLLKKVNEESQMLSKREKEVSQQESKYHQLINKYNQLSASMEAKQKEIINKAKEEAAQLLKKTNREIEKTIRHIKENKAEKKETRKVREHLEDLSRQIRTRELEETHENISIAENDHVRIKGQDVVGKVISIKDKNAIVQFGDMRSSVNLSKLEKSSIRQSRSPRSSLNSLGLDMINRQATFNASLDVRGKRAEEIATIVDQFLDDAILLGYHELRILHGKGEGVLRKIIRERLSLNKSVVSFGDEHVDRGGSGITIVVMK